MTMLLRAKLSDMAIEAWHHAISYALTLRPAGMDSSLRRATELGAEHLEVRGRLVTFGLRVAQRAWSRVVAKSYGKN